MSQELERVNRQLNACVLIVYFSDRKAWSETTLKHEKLAIERLKKRKEELEKCIDLK